MCMFMLSCQPLREKREQNKSVCVLCVCLWGLQSVVCELGVLRECHPPPDFNLAP